MRRLVAGLIAIIALLGLATVLIGQSQQTITVEWQPVDGLSRTIVQDIAPAPDGSGRIYAGTGSNGVYLTSDYVTKGWIKDDLDPEFRTVYPVKDVTIPTDRIRDILIHDSGAVFAGTWGIGVFWKPADTTDRWEPLFFESSEGGFLLAEKLIVAGPDSNTLYVGTYGGILRVDLADLVPNESPPDLMETGLVLNNENDECVQAITSQRRAYLKLDSGEILDADTYLPVNDLVVDPQDSTHLYAAIWEFGVCESRDAGASWHILTDSPDDELLNANALAISPTTPDVVFLGTFGRGIFRSEDAGQTWETWNSGDMPADADIWSLQFDTNGETLYAGTRYDGTLILPPNAEWQKVENLPYGALSLSIEPWTGSMLAGTWGGGVYIESEPNGEWTSLQMPLLPLKVQTIAQNSTAVFAGTSSDGVWRSKDAGTSWIRVSGQRTESDYIAGSSLQINALLVDSADRLYAGTSDGLFLSENDGDNWNRIVSADTPASRILSLLSMEQAGKQYVIAGTEDAGIFFFSLAEKTWHQMPTLQGKINALAFFEGNLYASVSGAGLFMAPHNTPLLDIERDDWIATNLPANYIEELQVNHSTFVQRFIYGTTSQLLAVTERGIYRSHDGQRWEQTAVGSYGSLAIDARHPQISYLSVVTNTYSVDMSIQAEPVPTATPRGFFADSVYTQTVRSRELPLLVSTNDDGGWPLAATSPDPDKALISTISTMAVDRNHTGRVLAATQDGLIIGQVDLPLSLFWREFTVYTLAGIVGMAVAVLVPATVLSYMLVTVPFGIALPDATHLFLTSLRQLQLVWNRKGETRLSEIEQLILLNSPSHPFWVSELWNKLDYLGVVPPIEELQHALGTLVHERGMFSIKDESYQLRSDALKQIATKTLGQHVDKIQERVRDDHTIYRNVDRFFTLAGFNVQSMGTEYLLRPEATARLAWNVTWARLHLGGKLTPWNIRTFGTQIEEFHIEGTAFIIVTDRPTPDGYRALADWNETHALKLTVTDIHSIQQALRERNVNTVLDTLLRRAEPGYDHFALYTPVSDALNFFGQKRSFDDLRVRIKDSPKGPIIVRSLPKTGVTSFLQRMQSTMGSTPCTIVELQYERSIKSLLFTITDKLLDDLQRKRPTRDRAKQLAYVKRADHDSDDVAEILTSLEIVIETDPDIERLVVLLDGASLPAPKQNAFYNDTLRLAAEYPHLLFVLSTNDIQIGAEQPTVYVDPLSRAETMHMVETLRAAMGHDNWPEAVVEAIYAQSGGHPWFVRQIGSALSRQQGDVTPEDVRDAAYELVDSRSTFFASLWEGLPARVRAGLLAENGSMPTWLQDVGLMDGEHIRIGMLRTWLAIEMGVTDGYAEYA